MTFIKDAKRIAIFGASGSGKSTLAAEILRGRTRVIVFDPLMEYQGRRNFTLCHSPMELIKYLKARWSGSFYAAYVPRKGISPADELHTVSCLLQKVQSLYFTGRDDRKITLMVEEMNLSFPVRGLRPDQNGFFDLCCRGRHYGIELIGISQRMAQVSTDFRGNASETYFLRLAEHNDLTAARAVIGPVWASKLRDMPKFNYILRGEDGSIKTGKTRK